MLFFSFNTGVLAGFLVAVIFGATLLGLWIGRRLRVKGETLREPLAVSHASLLGVVGLILAFGLTLAIGRYEARRSAVVDDANAIGTSFLLAQTLAEPVRSTSLGLLTRYADTEIALTTAVPGSRSATTAAASGSGLQRALWTQAGQALDDDPTGSAPRLYAESVNVLIDQQTLHIAAFGNRVPSTVIFLQVFGAAAALGMLGVYLSVLGRGVLPVLLGAALVTMLLFVSFDLDRPARGVINVEPTALVAQRAAMGLPPAATARK